MRALVLQMYGTGNAPAKKDGLLVAIREARARGVVVVSAKGEWKKREDNGRGGLLSEPQARRR